MGKNIAIIILSLCLLLCVYQLFAGFWSAGVLRAAEWRVRTRGFELWRDACSHAAAGDRSRQIWCDTAAKQTIITAADAGVSDEDMKALATDIVLREQKH
jgi:hypothetical protein